MKKYLLLTLALFLVLSCSVSAQNEKTKKDTINPAIYNGLKWRSIGPALTSGRIADFAVNPFNHSEYYVAVASGHIWKTVNAGVTYEPVFDNYDSYSIGCVVIDPNNTNVVWAGTGENNHQRALGYGDGVYKSIDGGKSWKNMGLKESRQIGEIVIDPRNSNIVFVAAEGSVWGPGGERGLYKTIDGGKTWKKVLTISENTGVNNIAIDPRNPDVMYATSEQRRRHVFTKIGGGPESAVYKSVDGGENWEKIMTGLPGVHIGGMDIAISPANPEYIYLIMEAAEGQGGFFRSTNRGASWEKMSDHTEKGQYYNEIYCDPKNPDKVYSVETVSQVTVDGGKTWKALGLEDRHVDDHALWIDPDNTSHFLIGGDGGVYETYDGGNNYNYKENLSVTQFYRVNVDNALPFYNVYGGTQDNNSLGGPSRTLNSDGITNFDWFVTNGGDGFWAAIDPLDPNIVYAESQYGGMVRYDKKSGEAIDIRPEPGDGELTFRWHWDTPMLISPHKNTRLYCAANKVFRSDDRGDTWVEVSGDLTRQLDRNMFPVMDKYWSIDAVSKDASTSLYGEIISLTESPIKENLLYAGTDDGLIQVTEDQKTWTKTGTFPGVPEYTLVSDICASRFDENVVFASFNNIKRDDFKPYILKSVDKGKTWKSISGNLPANGTVHSIEQDIENPDLLFAGTEFGFYFTTNGGKEWIQLGAGMPTIPVRDIAIQKREQDLVVATFGRGFFVLDDMKPLRLTTKEVTDKEACLYPVKDALLYVPFSGRYGQGASYFRAPNPDFGAIFTYYVKEVPKTLKEIRKEKEKELFKKGEKIPQPTQEELLLEKNEFAPYLVFTITDETGAVVRKINKQASNGINRIAWDLRYQDLSPVNEKDKFSPVKQNGGSSYVQAGRYKVSLSLVTREGIKELNAPVEFNVVNLNNTTIPAGSKSELVAFQKRANEIGRVANGAYRLLTETIAKINAIKIAINNTPGTNFELLQKVTDIGVELNNMLLKFQRQSIRPSAEESDPSPVTYFERLGVLLYTHYRSTSNITNNERTALKVLERDIPPIIEKLNTLNSGEIKNIENELEKLGAPYTPGRIPIMK